ncbi:MAG: TerB family tellurite resistance protein [Gammaproteobacteria bacterium]|nr:TerB family tellurite resistance protein [Gammaproteobacteria bacterium]MCP5460060.1 TerB family tellurite resistance protein [Gammaproteobacteria bacterium]
MNNILIERQDAMDELKRQGIVGSHVYLIDIIPLIEMIWADGHVHQIEVALLDQFIERHVNKINEMAGHPVLNLDEAQTFATKLLEQRPDPEWLRNLRLLIPPLRFTSPDFESNKTVWRSIVSSCLDIAASAVKNYPYEIDERINSEEKQCFFDILDTFGCFMRHGEDQ